MRTEIHFVGGERVSYEDGVAIKMIDHGVEVTETDGDEIVKVLFPWNRIEKVSQRGAEVAAIYTY